MKEALAMLILTTIIALSTMVRKLANKPYLTFKQTVRVIFLLVILITVTLLFINYINLYL